MSKISSKLNIKLPPPCSQTNAYDPALDPSFQTPGRESGNGRAFTSYPTEVKTPADKISNPVDHPSHYRSGGMEAIDVIEAFKLDRDFCLGNCAKYLLRLGRKDDELQDAKKCRWYLDRYIKRLEEQEAEHLNSIAGTFGRDYVTNLCKVEGIETITYKS